MKAILKTMVFVILFAQPANLYAGTDQILGTWSCTYKILFKNFTEEFLITEVAKGKLSGYNEYGAMHGNYRGTNVYLSEKKGGKVVLSSFFFNARRSKAKGKYLMVKRVPFGSTWYDMTCEKQVAEDGDSEETEN